MSKGSPVVAIIPARYNASRFPGKLLHPILGKSLLQHTYENVAKSSLIDKIFIAVDDKKLFDHAKTFAPHVVMTSTDCQNGTERIAQVCEQVCEQGCGEENMDDNTLILNVQGDEPCISQESLEKVILALKDPSADFATVVVPLSDSEELADPSCVKCVFTKDFHALYFSRSPIPNTAHKLAEGAFFKHLGLYAYTKKFLMTFLRLPPTPLQLSENLEQLKALEHGFACKVAVVHNEPCLGVNTPDDVEKVKKYLLQRI